MKTIYYRITLHEPTILTQIDGDPNSAVSYDFIPGSVLRGMVIGMYMRKNGDLKLADATVNRLFFSNNTRFLNAYPIINDQRALPVPNTWKQLKYPENDQEKYEIRDEAFEHKDDHKKRGGLNGFAFQNGSVHIHAPQRVLNVHTQRTRRNDKPEVYRYDALAPGQTFEAIIYCQDEDVDLLTPLLDNKHTHIGGARSAGYGKVRIQVIEMRDGWIPEATPQPDSFMVITLLSDMILRDENGHYSPTLSAFGYTLRDVDMQFTFNINHVIQTTLIGGFNRKWGLPLPQTPALKRGSVIVLNNVEGNINDLNQLIINGIGERRNEGFGQIAVNWQQNDILTLHKSDEKKPETAIEPGKNPFEEKSDEAVVWDIFKSRFDKMKVGDKKDE
ncbi:MAG: hypothetical protein KJ043_06295 [Anaerolineae bacterium]|nr:hypothetical protein [Anaerolineae bacterium]